MDWIFNLLFIYLSNDRNFQSKTLHNANNIMRAYHLIKGEEPLDPDALEEAIVYEGVAKFPARVKCATLAWKAMGAILAGEEGERHEE